jgi:cobalamin-dependent methionine synthase I
LEAAITQSLVSSEPSAGTGLALVFIRRRLTLYTPARVDELILLTGAPYSRADGRRASEAAREWFAENRYQDYLYLHGLSVEMAEALPNICTSASAANWVLPPTKHATSSRCWPKATAASRYSFGYPACPNLADQKQLLALLRAAEIGATLSEKDQLAPEQPTSAVVVPV